MKRYLILGVLICSAMAISPSMANGFYIGASYLDVDTEFEGAKDGDDGSEFRFGYEFNDFFDIEAGYVDLGRLNVSDFRGLSFRIENEAYSGTFIGNIPFLNNHLRIFGKVGYLWWEQEGTITGLTTQNVSVDGSDAVWGLGIEFKFTKHFSIRADYNEGDDYEWSNFGMNFYF